ncbi:MAG: STAS-like domain-containing protein [Dysgonamonadaceae bacterium]|nr:STAS-like domain-containing protein [Dysgonamonadaceae bacterium]
MLADKSSGTGTRQSGERIRNEIINLNNESGKIIEIDFSGVAVISSSFADELIGKLVVRYGFFNFNQIFRLKNMNEIVQAIVHRSVSQRMADSIKASN